MQDPECTDDDIALVGASKESSSDSNRRVLPAVILLLLVSIVCGVIMYELRNTPSKALTGLERAGIEFGASTAGNAIPIVHFNDLYVIGGVDRGTRGGAQRVAQAAKSVRAANPRSLLVFAGDLLSPSMASDSFKGQQMVDVLNLLPIDAATLGNHEFDFGTAVLQARLKESKFPWLDTNLRLKGAGLIAGTQRNIIKDVPYVTPKGINAMAKVCIFGIAYDVRDSVIAGHAMLDYDDIYTVAEAEASQLHSAGCTVVIALSHTYKSQDCQLSRTPHLDLIIGGHDHEAMLITDCGGAPILKGTSDLRDAWVTNLFLDNQGGLDHVSAKNFAITDGLPADPKVAKEVSVWQEKLAGSLHTVMGSTTVALNGIKKDVRTMETNLGDWVADSIRNLYPNVSLAFTNGGGVRGNKIYPAGDITRGDLVSIHPFGNTVVTIAMTGAEILAYIRETLTCYQDQCGNFLQVSGMELILQRTASGGARLVKATLGNSTELTEAMGPFRVATNNFIYSSDLQKCPLSGMAHQSDGLPLVTAMQHALQKATEHRISPQLEGRIQWE